MIIGGVLISSAIVALLSYADSIKSKAARSRFNRADKDEKTLQSEENNWGHSL